MAKGKTKKEQTQKLLATVVMGMNLVNTVAPMAAAAQAGQQAPKLPLPAASEAQPLDYAVLPQALDYLDRAVFATAEAGSTYDGNASGISMGSGDYQYISAGQSGTATTMSGGQQNIYSGGNGTVTTMNSGQQNVYSSGIGTVTTMNSGRQFVGDSGNGTVSTMSDGTQEIRGGEGTVTTMNGGTQSIISSGSGTVTTMNSGGYQSISSGGTGTVSTMNSGGLQGINGGNGTVSALNGGTQVVSSGGTSLDTVLNSGGTICQSSGGVVTSVTYSGGVHIIDNITAGYDNMTLGAGGTNVTMGVANGAQMSGTILNSGGKQIIYSGGTGTVTTMNSGGEQVIRGSRGSGTVSTMSGGYQNITGGEGTVTTMNSGYQYISSGEGTVTTMNGGQQYISSGGSGTVTTLNSGAQIIVNGNGTVTTMHSSGQQAIVSGCSGTITTMSGGQQYISSGGSGTAITINSGGTQTIEGSGSGTVTTMNSGLQTINSGGTGTVEALNSGTQVVNNSGIGTVSTMNSGRQAISGGEGTVTTMHSGWQEIYSGSGTVSTMSGGTQGIVSGGSGTVITMNSGGSQVISGGNGTVTTMNSGGKQTINSGTGTVSALNGGTQVVNSGGTSLNTVLTGGTVELTSGGTAVSATISAGTVYFASGGVVSDLTMSGGALELENVSGGSFNISGTMSANNGSIDMTDSSVTRASVTPAYETLTIADLKGSGNTFIMDTDLAGSNSDKVTITSADVGTHYVQIRDLSLLNSAEVKGEHQQLLITDSSGKLTFAGKELNLGGLFEFDPTITNGGELGLSGNDWYLTAFKRNVNNDTQVLLDAADNSYALWRNTNDSLRSRLGALGNGSERADGIWARTQAGRFSGSGYEGRYNLYQLGYDQKADAGSTYGFAVDYGDGTGTYDPGSGKDKLTAFSLYGIWQGTKGTYTNVTARAGIFDTDLKSYGDNPDKTSYKEHAYSISVEYGQRFDYRQGLFFEPQAQFTLGRLSGINYTTDRGANGYIEGMNSAIGRIGFVMGQKIKNGSDIYLKADLLHEFAGKRDLQMASDAGSTNDILSKHNDYGDTWFELGLGANIRLSKDSSFYGEVERGFGGDINKKWSVNAGLRFTF